MKKISFLFLMTLFTVFSMAVQPGGMPKSSPLQPENQQDNALTSKEQKKGCLIFLLR